MCVICGCNHHENTDSDGNSLFSASGHAAREVPTMNPSSGDLHFGAGPAKAFVPGVSQRRAIKIEEDVLGENNRLAKLNRQHFRSHGVIAYDLLSSPGSGKTTLLCKTIERLNERGNSIPVCVIEGDQQTTIDADRIRNTGASAIQINTGKGCHLDARMVGKAFENLGMHAKAHLQDEGSNHLHGHNKCGQPVHNPTDHDQQNKIDGLDSNTLLFIENVGNLVCPAMWDLGEAAKIVILSVTEGDDKPLKYPDMFAAADLLIINKTDLLPYVEFNIHNCLENARRINPGIDAIAVSATSGDGVERWIDWLLAAQSRPEW